MLFRVEVDLALSRPPKADVTVYVTLDESNHREAQLTAVYMASCYHDDTVMAVGSRAELVMDDVFPLEWWESEKCSMS